MRQKFTRMWSVLALVTLLSAMAFGQADTGQVSGEVTDNTGAAVVGAKVVLTSASTNALRTATSTSEGLYSFSNVKPDTYVISVQLAGFSTYKGKVTVSVGSKVDVPVKLAVAGSSTTVDISGSAEQVTVNTETQSQSILVSSKELESLPSLTRNPYDLVQTGGNVSTADASGRGVGVAINGQRSSSTDILLDGGENVDLYTATAGQSVPMDSVQEFRVVTSNFTAEVGRAGGGVVNVATKSGTNKLHGSLYEFNRLSALTSNTYYNSANGVDKGKFTRNQFGYTLGGPAIKDKLFYFTSTEWIRVRSTANISASVLDSAFLNSSAVSANTKSFFSAYGKLKSSAKVLNTYTWNDLVNQKYASANAALANLPTIDVVSYQVAQDAGGGTPQNTYMSNNRVDWNISNNTTAYFRYAVEDISNLNGSISYSPYAGFDTGEQKFNNNFMANLTHIFRPTLVSSSKFVFNRLKDDQPLGQTAIGPTLYSNYYGVQDIFGGSLLFPGYSPTTPGNSIPFGGPQDLYQFYQDLSWTKGKHELRFGGNYIRTVDNRSFGAYEGAVEYLDSKGSLTKAFDQLVAGNVARFQVAIDPQGKYPCSYNTDGVLQTNSACATPSTLNAPSFSRNNLFNDGAIYAQDSWKALRNLTLNLGVRWEYYGVQHNEDSSLDSNFYMGSGSTLLEKIRNGAVKKADTMGGLWQPKKKNFAPRLGFAWDVFGDGKTSLRGGYGIGYERNFGNVTFNVIQNPPAQYVMIDKDPTTPISTDNFGPLSHSPYLIPASLRAVDPNIKTAMTQTYSLAAEHSVFKNSILALEYSGAHGTHLYDISNISGSAFGYAYFGDSSASTGTNLQYSAINYRSSNGYSHYNSLNTKFTSRDLFHSGVDLNFNWTWSHSLDNLSSAFSEGGNGNFQLGYTNPFRPDLDFGNSEFDIRHRVVISAVWDIPFGKSITNKVLRNVVTGWNVSPIYTWHSGSPYSIYDGTNAYNNEGRWVPGQSVGYHGNGHMVADPNSPGSFIWYTLPVDSQGNVVGVGNSWGDVPIDPATGLSTCAGDGSFTGCKYGPQVDRNQFRGPGFWNADMVFAKSVKFSRYAVQFRGEFYNIFNHHNYYIVSSNAEASSGVIEAKKGGYGNSSDERRFVQLGLKFTF